MISPFLARPPQRPRYGGSSKKSTLTSSISPKPSQKKLFTTRDPSKAVPKIASSQPQQNPFCTGPNPWFCYPRNRPIIRVGVGYDFLHFGILVLIDRLGASWRC